MTSNKGSVRCITQLIVSSSAIRVSIAPIKPSRYAKPCCSTGSREAKIAMKTMLSMPSTISSAVSVSSAIQASGLVRSSSMRAALFSVTRPCAANASWQSWGVGVPRQSWDTESPPLRRTPAGYVKPRVSP